MESISKNLKRCRKVFIVLTVANILLIQVEGSRSGDYNLSVCGEFMGNKEIKHHIETGSKHAPTCACVEQQMSLDNSFEKIGRCYAQWFFEYGVKQMCCYNDVGVLQDGAPGGGYLLLEGVNMTIIKESCCSDRATCDTFYRINQSQNCSSYSPPEIVTSWGDPVIQTIDGTEYDFNGHGEYVFLKTSNLEIQARTDYVTPGNIDATAFSAFAIFDKQSNEQIEFHHHKTTEEIIIYRNGEEYCNSKKDNGIERPAPCNDIMKYKCFILAGGGIVVIQRCGIGDFAEKIEISVSGAFMKLTISKRPTTIKISGLAGKLQKNKLSGRDGSQLNVNASAYAIFNLSESWALQNENESLSFYSITGGNYTTYNGHHTVPLFLETLVGNLKELFKNFSTENITLFNSTCRNYWNGEPNEQCLLTIARTRNFSLGLDVMSEVNETRRKWEIFNNKPPKFLDGMPNNITATFKNDSYWTLDLNEYVSDETYAPLTYGIQTSLPTEEYSLENGVFNWTIGTGLRHIDTHFVFLATDSLNFSKSHEVSIRYCGCEQPEQCKFDVGHSVSVNHMQKASCECPQYHEGDFCEEFTNPCETGTLDCYRGQCNATVPKTDPSDKSWPCSPCPTGRHETLTSGKQNCKDIDECATEEDACHQGCENTDGSYSCTCGAGFDLDSDKFSCSDINECLGSDLCNQREVCINTVGSYTCSCAPGYLRQGTKSCLAIEAKTYVSTISFTVIITQDGYDEANVNTQENRNNIQQKLQKRYKGIQGFVSVQVIKLSITMILVDGNNSRKKRSNERAHLDAENVLYWTNQTVTNVLEKTLQTAGTVVKNDSLLKPDGVIPGLRILSSVFNVSVNTDICSIPEQHDCEHSSTKCVSLDGGYKCQCLAGYTYPKNSKNHCTEINECDLFLKDNTTDDRCVHGSCLNFPGSWNCTCPNDRLWHSVGNESVSVYRCQGNFSYIGTIRIHLMSANSSEKEIIAFAEDQLSLTFGNKSFEEETKHGVHISSIFVLGTVLTIDEDKNASNYIPHGSYKIMFKLRLGEAVDIDRLTSVLKTLTGRRYLHNNNQSDVYFQGYHIFNDSENILCNLTSYGDCDETTTTCLQRNGKTYCKCKSGYEKRHEIDKFCRDVNECVDKTYNCLGGVCYNSPGKWSCECKEHNFAPTRVDEYTFNCTVFPESCKDSPCVNGGTCQMINDTENETYFECICADGWTGKTCQHEHKRHLTAPKTDLETVFIATGSTLGGLVIILSIVVLVVCRWRGAKVKEATKLSKRYLERDGFKPLEGATLDDHYLDDKHYFHDRSSENSFRTFPRISSHGVNEGRFREINESHFKGSLPNLMFADAYIYRGEQRRHSVQEERRVSSYDREKNVDEDLTFESNRTSPLHDIERPRSPKPDYDLSGKVYSPDGLQNDTRRSSYFENNVGDSIKF